MVSLRPWRFATSLLAVASESRQIGRTLRKISGLGWRCRVDARPDYARGDRDFQYCRWRFRMFRCAIEPGCVDKTESVERGQILPKRKEAACFTQPASITRALWGQSAYSQ